MADPTAKPVNLIATEEPGGQRRMRVVKMAELRDASGTVYARAKTPRGMREAKRPAKPTTWHPVTLGRVLGPHEKPGIVI